MNKETLKKIVELADGFEWREQENKSISTADNISKEWTDNFIDFRMHGILLIETDDITIWQHYPLLIRRATEGLNNDLTDWTIWINQYFKKVYLNWKDGNNNKSKQFLIDYPKTDYLTPQEQAIEACLIELLEVE